VLPTFVLLLFALSVPFWVVGAIAPRELLPGLPVAALMAACPVVAASILVYRQRGAAGAIALLKRAGDWHRIGPIWYLPILLLMPGIALLTYGWMRLVHAPVPEPRISLVSAGLTFLAFLVFAAGEELGWSGYALDPVQERWPALGAAIVLGIVWAAWHIVALVQAHRSPGWIAWWGLGTVGSRVLMVWIYNNTARSVFAVILYHTMLNLSWQLFPNAGSHYDPRLTAVGILAAAVVVTVVWGPRTLAGSSSWYASRRSS
jgi:membrane protease YdiL (CAAX protease family)